jgi:NADH dehydrogenase
MAWNVVIVGGGFGGLAAARVLERSARSGGVKTTLVSDRNFLLYTPFLPEAAAGTLEPRHVVTPLRELLRHTELQLGSLTSLDQEARRVTLRNPEGDALELRYDRLVLAPGSVARTLPVPGLAEHGVAFKSLADAIWLRNHVIRSLELAETTRDRTKLEEILTFVFVGGGYAGLEALAELQDFAADAARMYPAARAHGMRWILAEAGPRVMLEIDEQLASYAQRQLTRRGIDIRVAATLTEVGPRHATLSSGEHIPTRTVVWTAGVTPSPIVAELGLPLDERGRIEVDEQLRVQGTDDVWALGDAAAVPHPADTGRVCPPTAQHATRQGRVAGHNVAASLGRGRPRAFRYVGRGSFVNLGRYKAVAMIGRRTLRGPFAWWLARTYHMSQIPGLRRKLRAVLDWTVSVPFARDVSEVGSIGQPVRLGTASARVVGVERTEVDDHRPLGDQERRDVAAPDGSLEHAGPQVDAG